MTTLNSPPLPVHRYTAELRREATRFAEAARTIPLTEPVPTCPGWTLGDLVRHVRQGHDWATTILATRSTEFVLPGGDLSGSPDEDRSWTERVAELGARGGAQEGLARRPGAARTVRRRGRGPARRGDRRGGPRGAGVGPARQAEQGVLAALGGVRDSRAPGRRVRDGRSAVHA
ncbi:maleylpyruvate isomerase N-terminal domain-containing protein [Streptomyces lasalocidi]